MKSRIAKIVTLVLVTFALALTAATSRAQDATTASTNAPAKRHGSGYLPFHGTVTAVDANAETLTVGKLTINITSATKITNATNNAPAILADVAVGETVGGSYTKGADGKLNAHTLHIGVKAKGGKAKKKKSSSDDSSSTNSVSAN